MGGLFESNRLSTIVNGVWSSFLVSAAVGANALFGGIAAFEWMGGGGNRGKQQCRFERQFKQISSTNCGNVELDRIVEA